MSINIYPTPGIVTTNIVHQRVHEGRLFSGGYYNASVADTASIYLLVQTGAQDTHAVFYGSSSGDATLEYFEGTTFSAAGTAVSALNHNRQSAKTFTGTITHTPTITANGTQLDGTVFIPGGTKGSGSGGSSTGFLEEMLLANSTNYLVKLTNVSGGVQKMNIGMACYQPNL